MSISFQFAIAQTLLTIISCLQVTGNSSVMLFF